MKMQKLVKYVVAAMLLLTIVPAATMLRASTVGAPLPAPAYEMTYVVEPGDSLWGIAAKFGTTAAAILDANDMEEDDYIFVGQELIIPVSPNNIPGQESTVTGIYIVQPLDTLWQIARWHDTHVTTLVEMNGLTGTDLFAGQVLQVPTAGAPAPASAPAAQQPPASAPAAPQTVPGNPTPMPPAALTAQAAALGNPQQPSAPAESQPAQPAAPQPVSGGPTAMPPAALTAQAIEWANGGGAAAPAAPSAPQPAAAPASNIGPVAPAGNFELGGQAFGFGPETWDAMRRSGMTWVKRKVIFGLGESPVQQERLISAAHREGFKIMISLSRYPGNMSPNEMDDFVRYAQWLAENGVDAIEIGNEVNLPTEWIIDGTNPAMYAELLARVYPKVKGANPEIIVISAGLAPTGGFRGQCTKEGCDDLPYLNQFVAAGGLNHIDCLGMHYNEGLTPPAATSGDPRGNSSHYTRYYRSMIDTYWNAIGGSKPLCITELGYLSGEEWGRLPAGFNWKPPINNTIAQHAQYLAEATALSATEGKVRLQIIWNVDFIDYGDDPHAGYAMIRRDGSCPACETVGKVMGVNP